MRPVAKCLSVAVGLVAVVASAGSALAHDEGHGWKHWHKHERVREVYVVERPVYYAPPPRMYYPEPRYYGPPVPPSLNINIPLR